MVLSDVAMLIVCFLVWSAPWTTRNPGPTVNRIPDGSFPSTSSAASDKHVGALRLSDGSSFKTTLYNLKVIGQLRTKKKLPYFILSGSTCDECDENISIYIHSPSDGPMKDEAEQRRFAYPGHEINNENGKPEYEARMFFGDCLVNHPNAVIWFQKSLGDDSKWHDNVLLAEVKDDQLVTIELHDNLPTLREVRETIRRGRCRELPGVSRPGEP